ncbi:MAG: hypothetical protein KDB27_33105, partial [Planctomycetales bacterium]|nr:hypothetical protein [Planctomycetales bacterium]
WQELAARILPEGTTAADELNYSLIENHVRCDEDFESTVARVEEIAELLGCSFSKAAKEEQLILIPQLPYQVCASKYLL